MALSINPSLPVIAAQGVGSATDGVVLQPGTTVAASVQDVLADNLVRIAIAGLSLDVLTEIALTPGQNLQLSVSQTQNGLVRLQIVGQGAATGEPTGVAPNAPIAAPAAAPALNDPLTPLERIAVSVASENAVTQQQSLAPLFANLEAAAGSDNLPAPLQKAIAEVLAQQTSLDENLSGGDIQNAVQKSGLFLEASLASGSIPATGGAPDLKAALIVLRQTLAAAVEPAETATPLTSAVAVATADGAKQIVVSPALAPSQPVETDAHQFLSQVSPQLSTQLSPQLLPELRLPLPEAAAGDSSKLLIAQALLGAGPRTVTSGAALNLLQEAMQAMPRAAANPADVITSPQGRSAQGTASTNTPPPPFRGALPAAQPVVSPSIEPNAPLSSTVHHLIDDTDGALARQTLLQVASLPDRPDANVNRIDQSVPRWNFEIPFVTPQGTAMAQFEISRDGGGIEVEAAKRTWQARFSINVEPAGPVHALISLSGERTSVRMWAERPQTAAQLRAGASELGQALSKAELSPGDIVIREGAPPQPTPAKAGHFLDRAL
jgi:hypothetical protein